jgi:hypothetical protein
MSSAPNKDRVTALPWPTRLAVGLEQEVFFAELVAPQFAPCFVSTKRWFPRVAVAFVAATSADINCQRANLTPATFLKQRQTSILMQSVWSNRRHARSDAAPDPSPPAAVPRE